MTHAIAFFITLWTLTGAILAFMTICMVEQASRWWEDRHHG